MIVLRGYREHRRRARIRAEHGVPGTHGGPRHWLWWSVVEEWESALIALRVAFDEWVRLPARWDVALSRWVERHRARQWPHAFAERQPSVPNACRVCEARWHAGRGIRHERCGQQIERAIEKHVYGRRSRRELIERFGYTPADVERILSH